MSTTAKLSIYEDDTDRWRLIEGDALAVLAKLPDNSIDAICADPPYGPAKLDRALVESSDAQRRNVGEWLIGTVLHPEGEVRGQ